jgi:biopolymer transport protein ExbD
MIRCPERRDDLDINLAPMIDMVFLLIIFFLTATTFAEKEREQDVLLPTNRIPGSLSRSQDQHLIVNVLEDGRLRVFGEIQSLERLAALVRDRRERAAQPLKVQVRADRRTAYGNVARALEAIERAGVQKPYIITKQVEIEE